MKCLKRKEEGNFIDQMGSIIVLAFVFVMILAFAAYGRLTEARLEFNNVAKTYLYRMEEYGYLRDEDRAQMVGDFEAAGAYEVAVNAGTTSVQQAYGDKVALDVTVEFQNPLYTVFSTEGAMFKIFGFSTGISYNIKRESTAKW